MSAITARQSEALRVPVVGAVGVRAPQTRSALLVFKQPAELHGWNEEQHTSPSSLRGASCLSADVWDEVLGLRRDDIWGVQNVFSLAHLVHTWRC